VHVSNILAKLGVNGRVEAAAAGSFAELVEKIAARWDAHWARPLPSGPDRVPPAAPGSAAPGPPPRSYEFRVWVDYADLDGGSFLETVTLEATGDELAWPLISCRRPDGTLVDFEPGEPDNRLCVYRVPGTT
jgi:hypothetical protein